MSREVLFFENGLRYRWPRRRLLRKWLHEVAEVEGIRLATLRLIMCSEVRLRDLHRQYLSQDTDTDVLTFDHRVEASEAIDGDVYLGLVQLRRQAKVWGVSFFEELARVSVHGFLHLCGYDDKTELQCAEMRAAEDRYLSLLHQIDESIRGCSTDVPRGTPKRHSVDKSFKNCVNVSRETSIHQS